MVPPTHVLARLRTEQADALEKPQHPVAHETLNDTDIALVELGGGMEPQLPSRRDPALRYHANETWSMDESRRRMDELHPDS